MPTNYGAKCSCAVLLPGCLTTAATATPCWQPEELVLSCSYLHACRARLQTIHHAYARHCEAVGDLKSAVQHYIVSGTAATEVGPCLSESCCLALLAARPRPVCALQHCPFVRHQGLHLWPCIQ